jgi:hypothetical protein
MSDIRNLFEASAYLKIPTLQLKAAVIAGRIANHGGELGHSMKISVSEAEQWFKAENTTPVRKRQRKAKQ